LDTFIEDIQIASPTLFISVPRLWTLFQKNIIDKIGYKKLNLLLSIPLINSNTTDRTYFVSAEWVVQGGVGTVFSHSPSFTKLQANPFVPTQK
jgi:hypothetical protein